MPPTYVIGRKTVFLDAALRGPLFQLSMRSLRGATMGVSYLFMLIVLSTEAISDAVLGIRLVLLEKKRLVERKVLRMLCDVSMLD